ncbi:hypothetical protein [Borrelia crocidurae]|uniref:Putative lipoprotein n=1 Tax=Borrelia crocidurae (strain Achema) TaxID=1155096 RepID=I0FE37_BORCA|nr:hypothetical protein [Borrelia crocidurae]AFI31743.1 Putative lipoprotein [Borrelia crocidurae str. Achema]
MRTYFTTVIFIFFILSCDKHQIKDFEKNDIKSLTNLSDDLYISREYIMKYEVYKELQDLNKKRPFIESLVKKHANSLVLQIKKFSETFSKQENGITPTVFIFGDYVQKINSGSRTGYYGTMVAPIQVETDDYLKNNFEDTIIGNPLLFLPSELDDQGRFHILSEPSYRFYLREIYDTDMYPVVYNIYISHKQPSIYLVGNKIYKKQNEIGNNIYYRKTLKLDVIKNSNEWILQPKEKENWEIDLSINDNLVKNIPPDYVYKIKSSHLESKIHEEMFESYFTLPDIPKPMRNISKGEKGQVDQFIEDNLEFFTQEIHRYSKDFSKIEDGIKELRILSRYEQVIPFDEIINNNYFHIYAAFYNMYFLYTNPKVLIVGNKNHKMKDNSGKFYNNAIVLNIDKKFYNQRLKISQEPLLEQVPVEPVTFKNDIINKCASCKLYLSEDDLSEIRQYLFKQNIYQEIKNAKENQHIIDSLVKEQANSLLRQMKAIIEKICKDDIEKMFLTIKINGAYEQSTNVAGLEYQLKNNKILHNPIINVSYEADTFSGLVYAYIYPIIYNMYMSKNKPSIIFLIPQRHYMENVRHIWYAVSVDRSTPKWTLYPTNNPYANY